MSSPRYEALPPAATEPQHYNSHDNASESVENPLLDQFASSIPSLDDDSDWEDERQASVPSYRSPQPSSSEAGPSTDTAATATSSSPSNDANATNNATTNLSNNTGTANTGIWGGLLNAVFKPKTTTNFDPSSASVTDGVFGNLVAKEETHNGTDEMQNEPPLPDENDDITPEGLPPTYEEASADATPSYWETTIVSYSYGDEIIVDQMPVGSLIIFAWTLLMSSAFSYLGFILTYLMHTTHAGKGGSFVGFGITLIQTSYDMSPVDATPPSAAPPQMAPLDPNSFDPNTFDEEAQMLYPRPYIDAQPHVRHGDSVYLSRLIFVLGIVLLIKGIAGYVSAQFVESAIKKRRREQEAQTEQARTAADAPDAVEEP